MRFSSLALLALLALLLSASYACNRDPDQLPDVVIVQPATGGGSSTGGMPSIGGPGRIGERCTHDADCSTGFCLRADDEDARLTEGTVPGGLCTAPCTLASQCRAIDPDSTCVVFGAEAYCVQSCAFGDPEPGEDKCAFRPELSCQPLLVTDAPECDVSAPCPEPLVCFEGTCSIFPACLPRCNGDFDCPTDRYCDPILGECVSEAPTGKLPGESCDPDASESECRGRCLPITANEAECDENCTLGAPGGCGFPDQAAAPIVCGFIAYDLGVNQGDLDEGACAHVCRCNDDCPGAQRCRPVPGGEFEALCVGALPLEDSIEECPPP